MPSPLVTVVIPVYNRSRALRATVDSVLAQSFTAWELLIVDDGSTDDTPEVARGYADPRVRYLRQENQGHSGARNTGLAEARGEFLAYLDHDDRWLPDKLAQQARLLQNRPGVGLVYGWWRSIDDAGVPQGSDNCPGFRGKVGAELLLGGNFIQSMSLPMMRTDLVRQVGGFNREMDIVDDLDLFLRLAQLTEFDYVPEVVLHYNSGSPVRQSRQLERGFRCHWKCIRRYTRSSVSFGVRPQEVLASWSARYAGTFRECGWKSLREGETRSAWSFYAQAVRLQPSLLRDRQMVMDLLALLKAACLHPFRTSRPRPAA